MVYKEDNFEEKKTLKDVSNEIQNFNYSTLNIQILKGAV